MTTEEKQEKKLLAEMNKNLNEMGKDVKEIWAFVKERDRREEFIYNAFKKRVGKKAFRSVQEEMKKREKLSRKR